MELLLREGIFVLISSKSEIPESFIQLFAHYPGKVHVQVGMTTVDESIRQLLEPKTASVSTRLQNIRKLVENGVHAELRMDPLVPELTDMEESFVSLLGEASKQGITHAVASYMFLRPSINMPLSLSFNEWSFREIEKHYYTHRIEEYCGTGIISVVAPDYRREKYEQLKMIAAEYGISVDLCQCKNKDITTECCHPQLPDPDSPQDSQIMLF